MWVTSMCVCVHFSCPLTMESAIGDRRQVQGMQLMAYIHSHSVEFSTVPGKVAVLALLEAYMLTTRSPCRNMEYSE